MAPMRRCSARRAQQGTTAREVQTSHFPVVLHPDTARPTHPPLSRLASATTLAPSQIPRATRRRKAGSTSVPLALPALQASYTAARTARPGKAPRARRPARCAPCVVLAASQSGTARRKQTDSAPCAARAITVIPQTRFTARHARQAHSAKAKAKSRPLRPCAFPGHIKQMESLRSASPVPKVAIRIALAPQSARFARRATSAPRARRRRWSAARRRSTVPRTPPRPRRWATATTARPRAQTPSSARASPRVPPASSAWAA